MGSNLKLYGGILLIGFAVYRLLSGLLTKDQNSESLQWAQADAPVKSKSGVIELSRSLTHQFTLQYALRIKNPKYRKTIAERILTSGLSAELNVDEFIGMQILWGVMFPLLLLILNFALQLHYPVLLMLAMSPVGFMIPNFHSRAMKNQRTTSVLADLPFFIDLLALSTEAGLDFQGAIQRIVEKSRGQSVLADELDSVLRDITLGSSRAQALKNLSYRLDIPEITSFVNVVVDADATGASVVKVLKDQSVQMRLERFVRAEKAGARASQAILIPLMVFILPAVFIMVFAPAILQFMYGGNK
jgi:tight adherence protein C